MPLSMGVVAADKLVHSEQPTNALEVPFADDVEGE